MKLPSIQHGSTFLVYITVTSTISVSPGDFNIYIKDRYGNDVVSCEVGDTPIDGKLSIMLRNTYSFDIDKYFLIISDSRDNTILVSVSFDVINNYEPIQKDLVLILETENVNFSGHLTIGELYGVMPDPSNLLEIDSNTPELLYYTHNQLSPNSRWVVSHFLNKYPSVVVVDSAGTTVYGEIVYVDKNIINLEFSHPFAGKAFIN